MYNDPMMASVLYRLEAEEAAEAIERRRVALEHPGMIRRSTLWARARGAWTDASSPRRLEGE